MRYQMPNTSPLEMDAASAPRGLDAVPSEIRSGDDPWSRIPPAPASGKTLARARCVALEHGGEASRLTDVLRTRLLAQARRADLGTIAITAPRRGCGATTVALNLAVGLSRLAEMRCVLLDANPANPTISETFDLAGRRTLAEIIDRSEPMENALVRVGGGLAVGALGGAPDAASDLLHRAAVGHLLKSCRARLRVDIVLLDMSAMAARDDVSAVLPHVDACILVLAAGITRVEEARLACRRLADEGKLLGTVLNGWSGAAAEASL